MNKIKKVRRSFKVPKKLYDEFHIRCDANNRKISYVIEYLMKEYSITAIYKLTDAKYFHYIENDQEEKYAYFQISELVFNDFKKVCKRNNKYMNSVIKDLMKTYLWNN